MSNFLQPHGMQHIKVPCPSPSPGVCSNSYPLSQWYHPTISSSITHFFSCPHSFPASGFFPIIWLFASGSQSIGASASASVLPMNIQSWFPLELTGWLPVHGTLKRVFTSTTVQQYQFSVLGLHCYNSHIHTWYWKNHSFEYLCWQSDVSAFKYTV